MAVVFTKDIPTNKLLFAYNNNIVEFNSNTANKIPMQAQITGLGINALIYPNPSGRFYFNFMEWIKPQINTKNFADDVQYNLVSLDQDTFTYDVADGCYLQGSVLFQIIFTDQTSESVSRSLKFIAAVENIETFKKNEIIIANSDFAILSPVNSRSDNTVYLKYWQGYPFEFSYYTNFPTDEFTLKNHTNGLDFDFISKGAITSFMLSDGRTDVTIENFIPIAFGRNTMRIEHDGDLKDNIIIVDKEESRCGIYLKWLNKFGRYNYWLFKDEHFRNRNSRYGSEINNDFQNLEDTTSPILQTDKNSQDTIKCIAEKITLEQKNVLDGISDSLKIYKFVGERFSKSSNKDWIEVNLKTSNFILSKPHTFQYKMELEIELPARYTHSI